MTIDAATGDATGTVFPAHPEAFEAAGPSFLTEAFRRFGVLSATNSVARIVRLRPCTGGSTGQKLFVSVEYAEVEAGLEPELFVKFSRDFADPLRDAGRWEMESEVRLAALARDPAFPIAVPRTYFADFHAETGTGILVTSRVAFGEDGIEPQLEKCGDRWLAEPLAYYRTVLSALARLAAAHKSGALGDSVHAAFPFDADAAVAADPIPWDPEQLAQLVTNYAHFAERCPRLLPPAITERGFLERFLAEAIEVRHREIEIKRYLHADLDYVALCHWNAQLDNAWFWHAPGGELRCGLLDWGRVRQLNLAYALWGCLVGADPAIWRDHLDELLDHFIAVYHEHGGPRLDPVRLKIHLQLYAATIGIAGILIAPERILLRLPSAETATGPHDPVFADSEEARCFLHILTVFMGLWRSGDMTAALAALPGQA